MPIPLPSIYGWFRLAKCRRSDQKHFDSYNGLSQNLSNAIPECMKRYRDADDADLHICISHKRCRVINSEKQSRASQCKQCIEIPARDDHKLKCFVGTRLVMHSTVQFV